jgi:hypothetical protein
MSSQRNALEPVGSNLAGRRPPGRLKRRRSESLDSDKASLLGEASRLSARLAEIAAKLHASPTLSETPAALADLASAAAKCSEAINSLSTKPPAAVNSFSVIQAAQVLASLIRQRPLAPELERPVALSPNASRTERELLQVCSPEVARRSLCVQASGLAARGPAPAVRPATTNSLGCWLASSRGQQNGGHCQMAPLFPRRSTRAPNGAGAVSQKRMPQLLHRLAIRA